MPCLSDYLHRLPRDRENAFRESLRLPPLGNVTKYCRMIMRVFVVVVVVVVLEPWWDLHKHKSEAQSKQHFKVKDCIIIFSSYFYIYIPGNGTPGTRPNVSKIDSRTGKHIIDLRIRFPLCSPAWSTTHGKLMAQGKEGGIELWPICGR